MRSPLPARPVAAATPSAASVEELVSSHLPLVHYLVAELSGRLPRHVARDDLTSAGMTALVEAARSFDPARGASFGSHARTRIRGALLDELRSQDWAARSVRAQVRRRDAAVDHLTARNGRLPERREVAAHLGVSVRELDGLDHDVQRAVVLSYQALTEEQDLPGTLPASGPTPEQVLVERERQAYLLDAVQALPDKLRTVVVGYFLDERPMAELAAELGVTESRISQLRAEAVALLREGMNAQLDPESLPAPQRPDGRVARRKAAYYAAVAARSDYRSRLSVPTPRRGGDAGRNPLSTPQEAACAAE